ncbi:MAG TPA: hypothetical protein V6C81_26620 [Planktothrix sp.]|jgi:hypothetical protein
MEALFDIGFVVVPLLGLVVLIVGRFLTDDRCVVANGESFAQHKVVHGWGKYAAPAEPDPAVAASSTSARKTTQ